jgi:hypothetical protein
MGMASAARHLGHVRDDVADGDALDQDPEAAALHRDE